MDFITGSPLSGIHGTCHFLTFVVACYTLRSNSHNRFPVLRAVRLVGPYALNTKINNKTNFLLGFGPFLKTKK
jgi:hypothetical protein